MVANDHCAIFRCLVIEMHCKKKKTTNISPFLAGPLPIRPPANPNVVPLNGQVRKLYRKLFICSDRELITEPSDFPKPLLVEWTTLTTAGRDRVRGKLGKGDKIIQNLRSDKRHKNCEIQIVSDFNVNNLNFAQHELTNTYLETMFSNNLLPVITRPTRIYHTSCELEILRQNQLDPKDFFLISSVFDLWLQISRGAVAITN